LLPVIPEIAPGELTLGGHWAGLLSKCSHGQGSLPVWSQNVGLN
jgi:hypothetical protein